MEATAFDEENGVLEPPRGVSESEVHSLSVFRDGNVVVSCWKPSAAELAEINKTGRIWLLLWGRTMPPALLMGTSPFDSADKNRGSSGGGG